MKPSDAYPSYRDRFLPAMTRATLARLPGKETAVVLLSAGAIEQHGPHLPTGVDSMLGQAWISETLSRLPEETPVYIGPAVTFGKSNEHLGFPGTVSISATTLRRQILAIATQLNDFGFRTLAILNTHGGNSAVLVYTLREIQSRLGMNACMLRPDFKPPVSEQESAFGFHAGEVETAWMLAAAPHLVAMDQAATEFPGSVDENPDIRPGRAPITFGWKTADLSASGVMGDAAAAVAANGKAWLHAGADALAAQILRLVDAVRPSV